MKRLHRICLLGVICLLASCRSADYRGARENFYEFYDRFLADSSFQMQRIEFPLQGIRYDDAEDSTYTWTRDEWVMLHQPDLEGTGLERRLEVKGDTLATDEIFMENTGFYFKMVYEPIKRKWHLVYLIDSGL